MAGAPKGSKNAARGTEWRDAIRKAVAMFESEDVERGQALRKIADVVVIQALSGNKDAIQEIGNRLDGKPHQSIDIGLSSDTPAEDMSDAELDSELARLQDLIDRETNQKTSKEKPSNVH